ncbi:hypothetical protein [Paenibacillus sp. GP183]|jgi:acyl-[acyl carrier protein]--UDP-N-acetylglucosamine O-acyltransferase|uniref:hypothetical protein n=1 Tax=Paenibacillus sp. GP183 TaxID=1882751 RepID=UPI0011154708|nr:hypothetical protein [Paenibacillus sp. GP183]
MIHPTALVHQNVVIGDGVHIGQFSIGRKLFLSCMDGKGRAKDKKVIMRNAQILKER